MQFCFTITLLIVTLLGNTIKLQATITGPAPAGGYGPGSPLCPICYQGPAGTPGNPGPQGIQGQVGPAGVKGDAGVKGQKGEIGPTGAVGNTGPKGDNGIGLPGNVGPTGLPGFVGATGEVGVKGQKGEPGETPDNSANRVAFTVTRTSDTDTSDSQDTRLPFELAKTLLPGTIFDLTTGTFTCNLPGTYVFTFSVGKYYLGDLYVHLRKNGDRVVSAISTDSQVDELVYGSAVLILQRADSVYLSIQGKAVSWSNYPYTSFSGFLLYPN